MRVLKDLPPQFRTTISVDSDGLGVSAEVGHVASLLSS